LKGDAWVNTEESLNRVLNFNASVYALVTDDLVWGQEELGNQPEPNDRCGDAAARGHAERQDVTESAAG
jgi:hypothetical protein